MDTFETSANHRNTWTNYPSECYPTSVDYYRPYGAACKDYKLKYLDENFILLY